MKNRALSFALIAFCCVLASANTGVAFVHGTGKQTDALNAYWTSEMVNSVRQGLPNQNNYVVINCDFSQYMWHGDAAGCLAGSLLNFINSKESPTWWSLPTPMAATSCVGFFRIRPMTVVTQPSSARSAGSTPLRLRAWERPSPMPS